VTSTLYFIMTKKLIIIITIDLSNHDNILLSNLFLIIKIINIYYFILIQSYLILSMKLYIYGDK